ncbi:MAG TPA: ribonuclease III [Acidobacteriota bacterium]|nr:ribonuclease III [Acidobacteriota bacterium]HMZ79621.1 ribonuclease III [Acidobacteriota bacterium]HNB73256.1 ribonuclease III [Acidobacteriota bacterium]HNH83108.1 ribonuclease III [Acidobacteriota bacterium]HNJ39373.1 ribonuclease III [Acidobacteriota bacterium]
MNLSELEERIGYQFQRPELLERALTHRSYANEHSHENCLSNEGLEFLGDAVLGLIISEWLVERFPDSPEGVLARFKGYLVSSLHLAECAQMLELGKYLRLNRGEEKTGGRRKRAILENSFEAILAALYLDAGLARTATFVRTLFEPSVATLDPTEANFADSKTALQDWLRSHRMPLPEYFTVASDGPPHSPEFSVGLRLGSEVIAQGRGPTLKAAHQAAASMALKYLKTRHLATRTLKAQDPPPSIP